MSDGNERSHMIAPQIKPRNKITVSYHSILHSTAGKSKRSWNKKLLMEVAVLLGRNTVSYKIVIFFNKETD
jgi:hypothetical protein